MIEISKNEAETYNTNRIDDADLKRPQFRHNAVSVVNEIVENAE